MSSGVWRMKSFGVTLGTRSARRLQSRWWWVHAGWSRWRWGVSNALPELPSECCCRSNTTAPTQRHQREHRPQHSSATLCPSQSSSCRLQWLLQTLRLLPRTLPSRWMGVTAMCVPLAFHPSPCFTLACPVPTAFQDRGSDCRGNRDPNAHAAEAGRWHRAVQPEGVAVC